MFSVCLVLAALGRENCRCSGKQKAGNARVANREKYSKLVKRRKGAVQEMREAAPDGATYEGEATGVRTHLRKSLRLS